MSPLKRVKILMYRLYQQRHRCFYCGINLADVDVDVTLDHVIPKSLSSYQDKITNVVACCRECNNVKGDRVPTADEEERLDNLNFAGEGKKYLDHEIERYYEALTRTPVYNKLGLHYKLTEIERRDSTPKKSRK